MLFALRFAEPIARGEVDLTFRRWRRAQVRPGRPYRTPVGRLQVDEVDVVEPGDLAPDDARRAGFASVDAVLAEADRHAAPDAVLFRVRFHPLDEPDPRAELAAAVPGGDDLAAVCRRLDAMDARSGHGPWAWSTLATIGARPGVRAPDLAASFGRETAPFKADVRRLKALGLTYSLPVGYELSPRGRAVLAARA
ncbi:ASCH domain-containing protein [Actinomycetospora sp. C-140]